MGAAVWFDTLFQQTPNAPAGLAVTVLVVAAATLPLARRLRVPPLDVAAWLTALGVVLSLTLSPRPATAGAAPVCALDSWSPLGVGDLLAFDQRAANVVLLVPLALLSGLVRDRRLARAALLTTAALPLLIEAVQYAVPALGRVCDSADLVDNLTGVAVGAAVGLLVRAGRASGRWATAAAPGVDAWPVEPAAQPSPAGR
ncbi:VanZ family protein [Cellulomonas iranensis]|uniref:VanZ family protein n=1 Tax=Cellulomonas iranensis TaxID=76862 RepID=UPI001CF36D27|nr:VanZ family protein [Cellulomonas iranensis]UCN14815.1 VanZ family protein [Cellulomonas iranensis]